MIIIITQIQSYSMATYDSICGGVRTPDLWKLQLHSKCLHFLEVFFDQQLDNNFPLTWPVSLKVSTACLWVAPSRRFPSTDSTLSPDNSKARQNVRQLTYTKAAISLLVNSCCFWQIHTPLFVQLLYIPFLILASSSAAPLGIIAFT